MIAILLVTYNKHAMTAECLESLRGLPSDCRVWLLDNASQPPFDEYAASNGGSRDADHVVRSEVNLGFAAGMNRLLFDVVRDSAIDRVLLLNNDTLVTPGFLQAMLSKLDATAKVDMVAARLLNADDSATTDSLGITLYRSGLASNRKHSDERLLGPTGGCMLLSRRLIDDLHASYGEWFDESFFCYAEDTDLVMRARWLGYAPAFADDAVVLHRGSASSGGPDTDFVLYHGIRNSIWALTKNAPVSWLLVHSPWLIVAHAAIWLRNLRKGRLRTLLRLYRDAFAGLPAVLRKRRLILRQRRVSMWQWWRWVQPSLYERNYLRQALRDLFSLRR